MVEQSSIEAKVKKILLENFDKLEEADCQYDKSFIGNFGMDSLDMVILLLEIEKTFAIKIPDSDIEYISTIGDLINYLNLNTNIN